VVVKGIERLLLFVWGQGLWNFVHLMAEPVFLRSTPILPNEYVVLITVRD